MTDAGHEETENVLKELEKRISKEYAQAEKEIAEKLDDYMRRFEIKDELKRKAVENGQITEAEYKKWRVGQIAIGERWTEMKDTLADDLTNTAQKAKSIAYGYMPEVYAINHNYGTFQVEQESMVDTSYTLYDRNTAQRLFDDKATIYHKAGRKVTAAINAGKQKAWNKRQIQSVMLQGLLQGESIGKIATRLSKAVGERDRKAAIRNARTMATGVQNAGRIDSYKRAQDMGIDLMQEWLATLDGRTRHEHRQLDGQRVPVGEKFKIDGYELEYPADPSAPAYLVYNCRCTLVPALKGFEVDSTDLSLRNTNHMEEKTYEEWKTNHPSHSDPITKQDEIASNMQNAYNKVYSKYKDGKYVPKQSGSLKSPFNSLGNAEKVMGSDLSQISNDYMSRMNTDDADKFKKLFNRAKFAEGTNGSEYNPRDNKIYIDKSKASEWTAFHESTHWFDFNTHYKITEDWGRYEYDANGNKTKWISKIVTIKDDASFSEYISHKWNAMDNIKVRTKASDDLKNFVKIIGTSDTYGKNRSAKDIVHDISAVNQYLSNKGISKTDPDFPHLSDFLSAISYNSSSGYGTTGGHDYDYWAYSDTNRVAEVTAGYNILKALGREDLIQIERELAPNLMKLIEEEWSKIW